jgi:hypothetical protein
VALEPGLDISRIIGYTVSVGVGHFFVNIHSRVEEGTISLERDFALP